MKVLTLGVSSAALGSGAYFLSDGVLEYYKFPSGSLGTKANEPLGSNELPLSKIEDNSLSPSVDAGELHVNFEADSNSLPVGVSNSEELEKLLEGISKGGGQGSETINWSSIPTSTLRVPEVNLSIPIVSKGVIPRNDGSNINDVEIPVSFQCAWNSTTAPLNSLKGTSVLSGHVNYPNGDYAPMSNLYWAKEGMRVITCDSNSEIRYWRITNVGEPISQEDLSQKYNTKDLTGSKRLLMLTCHYNNSTGVFDQNLPVEAKPE